MSTKNIALVVLLLAVAYYLFLWKKDATVVAAPTGTTPTGVKEDLPSRSAADIGKKPKTPMPQARVNVNTTRSNLDEYSSNGNQPLPGLGSVSNLDSKTKFTNP